MQNHHTIFTTNDSNKKAFIASLLLKNKPNDFRFLSNKSLALFSKITIQKFIDEEEIHDKKIITKHTKQSLKSMSSGEQKRVLLHHLLELKPNYLILDNPFDNLDINFQEKLKDILLQIAKHTSLLLIISRIEDVLPIHSIIYKLEESSLKAFPSIDEYLGSLNFKSITDALEIPINHKVTAYPHTEIIRFKNVSVDFDGNNVLHNINWTINKGDFWQLIGENGSGKTTLLSMLIGENSKGYGKELYLFGKRKGSGESIWDIKKKIGYFTPTMTENFTGNHSLENMLISGFNDSVGLYTKPTELQLAVAKKWLELTDLLHLKNSRFCDVSVGQQRLSMLVRAMIKQPLLLILDEPTAGLDDECATLFVALVNKIAALKNTAIIFVSHRKEPNLKPRMVFELCTTADGSIGKITT
tara:strand:+ start:624 stop:1865 length:1242 start_codon:yes stop_codon:yes gene_type:complete